MSLTGEDNVAIAATGLAAKISGSSHKARAPVVSVSVLFTQTDTGANQAEVSWTIESGKLDGAWQPLAGRRYDSTTQAYVDERIDGWEVRLDSVDDESVGGNPTAITLSVRRARK